MTKRSLRIRHWARSAGKIALNYFEDVEAEWKKGESIVTQADRDIERFLRDKIQDVFPQDKITGEEFEKHDTDTEGGHWFIDPIDGTASFSMGLPVWTVSIGVWEGNEPRFGVIWSPFMREEYWQDVDSVRYRNQERLSEKMIDEQDWNSQTLFCVPSSAHRTYDIDFPGKCRSLGSTAYHMGLVLDGRALATLMGGIHIWDIAAGIALGSSLNIELIRIDGKVPDLERLIRGATPQKPLLFGHRTALEDLLGRVQIKGGQF